MPVKITFEVEVEPEVLRAAHADAVRRFGSMKAALMMLLGKVHPVLFASFLSIDITGPDGAPLEPWMSRTAEKIYDSQTPQNAPAENPLVK